jgi:small subunit ribosomal protein S4
MARITGAVCRMCRREGAKLFLKGTRCDTQKCAQERRPSPPGMHTFRRGKSTDYGLHLREKQKVKHYYGVLERQFRIYFGMAERSRGNSGKALMAILERRLDNIVFRLGFGLSRSQARQLIAHGHLLLNGRRCDIPSALVRVGDVITVKDRPKSLDAVKRSLEEGHREVPDFLSRTEGNKPEGVILRLPEADDVSIPVEEQLIVELCSK